MNFEKQFIPEVICITPQIFKDDRGYFFESYHKEKFANAGFNVNFVQDNQSSSKKGTLRGLHYQLEPKSQGKLVRVLHGEIFDVAVDIRKGSKTFGKWVAKTLTSNKKDMLYIPPGFAHGFYVISDTADVFYKCTDTYSPKHERSIIYNDKTINIAWPFAKNTKLFVSPKDLEASSLEKAEIK